jgi:hypothetical protein
VIGVLPAAVSRHNCPSAPFAVTHILAAVSAPKAGKTVGIVTLLSSTADAMVGWCRLTLSNPR